MAHINVEKDMLIIMTLINVSKGEVIASLLRLSSTQCQIQGKDNDNS